VTPAEILARYLYQAHPIIYRSWNNADVSVRDVYVRQARVVIDTLADAGFRIVSDADERSAG
jgi:hypothetical protein